jgi:glycosyltransferase involved in cell wall biosynthesis
VLSIVIPFIDQPEITIRCLERLTANTTEDYELVLIDNASRRPLRSSRSVGPFSRSRYLRNEVNIGVLLSIQQGLAEAAGDVVAVMHNDVLLHEAGWNRRVEEAFKADPKLGLAGFVGARGCAKDGGRIHTMSHLTGEEWGVTRVKPAALHHGELISGIVPAAVLDGLMMIFRKQLAHWIAKVTTIFDPDRAPHHWYDRNISLHFLEQGCHLAVIGIRCDHLSGATANSSLIYRDSARRWCQARGIPLIDDNPDYTLYKYGERQFHKEWSRKLPVNVAKDHAVVWRAP